MLYAVKGQGDGQTSGALLEKTRRLNRALRREVLSKEVLKALQEPIIVATRRWQRQLTTGRSH
jgi:hypothetical protein